MIGACSGGSCSGAVGEAHALLLNWVSFMRVRLQWRWGSVAIFRVCCEAYTLLLYRVSFMRVRLQKSWQKPLPAPRTPHLPLTFPSSILTFPSHAPTGGTRGQSSAPAPSEGGREAAAGRWQVPVQVLPDDKRSHSCLLRSHFHHTLPPLSPPTPSVPCALSYRQVIIG